jgi:sugar O-acyltransferase (sialic acid O-acetyltransferase NeuD family)
MTASAIVPIGLSGNLREIFEALENSYSIPAILDDDPSLAGSAFESVPVLPTSAAAQFPEASFICLIGSPASFHKRAEIIGRFGIPKKRFATVAHPSAQVSRFASIGGGTVLFHQVTVTSNAHVGEHVLVLPQSVIHHDVIIGPYSLIGAGTILAGDVTVGESCYIGSGTCVQNGVSIGDGALVGMGSVVIRDVPAGSVVAGNPARPLKT